MSKINRKKALSNILLVACTLGFVWALVYNLSKRNRSKVNYPYTEVIDAHDSPVDSIVNTKDSTLYYKGGTIVGWSVNK